MATSKANRIITILTTIKRKKDAEKLSEILLRKNLVACVQMMRIKSHYKWKNKIRFEREFLLIIKTCCKNHKKIKRIFAKKHPYELPEFVYFKANASKKYKKWVESNLY